MPVNAARAALALALFTTPAAAECHKFTRWYYPWPQRCPVYRWTSARAPLPIILPPERGPEIPLPSMEADWGDCPDDMKTRLILLGKAISDDWR